MPPPSLQSACEQELDMVLEEISKITSMDNRGPLEDLYVLKFPNCDRHGLYNLKQVSHGLRTSVWSHNPVFVYVSSVSPFVDVQSNYRMYVEVVYLYPSLSDENKLSRVTRW